MSAQSQRFAAAGAVVLLVAASVWLWGRDAPEQPSVAVVATSQPWAAGRVPGAYVEVQAPRQLAAMLVAPDDLAGMVAVTDIAAGVILSPRMLMPAETETGLTTSTVFKLTVDTSLWPEPGPAAGDTAVFSPAPADASERAGGRTKGLSDSLTKRCERWL